MTSGTSKSSSTPRRPRCPQCPRCGYDQSGLVASWTHSCPLTAICTECGYAFDPFDAIDPTRRRLPWLYEHAKHWWNVPTALKTLLVLLWPPAFWKRVRPEHRVRPIRLIAWPILLAAVSVVTFGVLYWASYELTGYFRFQFGLHNPGYGFIIPRSIFRPEYLLRFFGAMIGHRLSPASAYVEWRFPDSIIAAPAFTVAALAVLVSIPSAWKREAVAPRHFLRVGVYSLAPAIFVHALYGASLVWSWTAAAVSGALYFSGMTKDWYTLGQSLMIEQLFNGEAYFWLFLGATLWQLLYFASALRTGLSLRWWFRLWLLCGSSGLLGVACMTLPRVVREFG